MTVSYHLDIATTGPFAFFKVLFRWKASIWKRTLVDMITWVAVYSLISVLYRLVLFDRGQMYLEKLAPYLDTRLVFFPVDFILGFFVIIVFKRWEGIFNNIGFIDNCALNVSAYIPGDDPKIIILRRNILRYICLSQVLVLRDVSVSVKLRFPNMAAVEDAGCLTQFCQP
uniref:Bestrophin homolog n=1 Tax=Ditylenchus dipsaci TaxID=166011 RepID=A0A915CMP6_9BILA